MRSTWCLFLAACTADATPPGHIGSSGACLDPGATLIAEDDAYIDVSLGGTPIEIDADYVYWAGGDGTSILRASKAGGAPQVLAQDVQPFYGPRAIAVDATRVYWVDLGADAVLSVPLAGGTPAPFYTPSDHIVGRELLVSGSTLLTPGNGTIWMLPIAGGTAVALGAYGAESMAADTTDVYFSGSTDCIDSYPLAGPHSPDDYPVEVGPSASCQSGLGRVAVSHDNVYALTDDRPNLVQGVPGDIVSLPKTGGAPVTFASALDVPTELVVDGDSLYVAAAGVDKTGSIVELPLRGGAGTTLAHAWTPRTLAVDDSSVYWVEAYAVCKIAK